MTSIPSPPPTAPTLPAEPSPVPRPVTPRVRHRAWTEPSVRLWWLLGLALAAVIGYFCVDVFLGWNTETKLIHDGVAVTAEVTEAAGQTLANRPVPADSSVTLRFDWNGKPIEQTGYLEDRVDYISVGEKLPIRVNPTDPSVWTSRMQPASLAHVMFPGLIFLPGLPLLAAAAYVAHRRVMRLWTTGEPAVGVVHMVRQSAIAPRTYSLRCTFRDRRGKQLHTVFVPKQCIKATKGEVLWLLIPPENSPGRPVAAAWLE